MNNRFAGSNETVTKAWSLIWNRLGNAQTLKLTGRQEDVWIKLWSTSMRQVAPDVVLVAREVLDEATG